MSGNPIPKSIMRALQPDLATVLYGEAQGEGAPNFVEVR